MEEQGEETLGTPAFVSVPVPVERVLEVYALLATPHGRETGAVSTEAPPPSSPSSTTPSNELPKVPWTEKDLTRFINSETKMAQTVTGMMDVLVERPGEHFTTTELVERLGVTRHELRGSLSALSRHIRKHYGRTNWPFDFVWGPSLGDDYPAEAHYTIVNQGVIAAWKKLRPRGH
jgi:hypothetical protein